MIIPVFPGKLAETMLYSCLISVYNHLKEWIEHWRKNVYYIGQKEQEGK